MKDKALVAAQKLLAGRVCECGELVFDHSQAAILGSGKGATAIPGVFGWRTVKCRKFRTVHFTVKREK